jgi:predicted SAM-dependent methyltransferase
MDGEVIKLNLGSNGHPKEGFINCDVRALPEVDQIFSLTSAPYPFGDESVSYIACEETIEHLPRLAVDIFFKECWRILKVGGSIFLQCPDIGTMCDMYAAGQVCDCVPHKAERFEDFKPNPDCPKCRGRARINTTRWLMAFLGAQKHDFDYHRMLFTQEIMNEYLLRFGFRNINFRNNIYKIKVTAYK